MTIEERITSYLGNGGLFNPEHMEHDKVRDLLIDCRTELASLREQVEKKDAWGADLLEKYRKAGEQVERLEKERAIAVEALTRIQEVVKS